MVEQASVDEGGEVSKRLEHGRETPANSKEAPEAATAAAERRRVAPRGDHQAAASGNGSPDWLGRSLRRLYQGTVNEPIPEKFRELLNRLDEQDDSSQVEGAGSSDPAKAGNQP